MKIGVVGSLGVVGSAYTYAFKKLGHRVFTHDIATKASLLSDVLPSEIVFICVPTPQREDGSCNTSIVEGVVEELDRLEYTGIVAIKSTIQPGTTAKLRQKFPQLEICFVPEFLRERHAVTDATEGMDVCLIGCYSDVSYQLLKAAHGHYPKHFVKLTPTEAELAKYFNNVYNALRVTFANDFYEVCQALGADYGKIKSAMVLRPTIEDIYLDCNDNFRGFAGPCLPKDTAALAKLTKDLGIPAQLFTTIVEDNKLYKLTVPEGMRL